MRKQDPAWSDLLLLRKQELGAMCVDRPSVVHTLVIMVSGIALEGTQNRRAFAHGVDGIMALPCNLGTLAQKLEQHMHDADEEPEVELLQRSSGTNETAELEKANIKVLYVAALAHTAEHQTADQPTNQAGSPECMLDGEETPPPSSRGMHTRHVWLVPFWHTTSLVAHPWNDAPEQCDRLTQSSPHIHHIWQTQC